MKKFFLKTLMQIQSSLHEIHLRSLEIMATVNDVKAAVQAARDASAAEKIQVQEKLDALSSQIADLALQIEASASGEVLDEVVAELNQVAADIAAIYEPAAEAPAEEVSVDTPAVDTPAVDEPAAENPTEETPQPLLP